MNGDRDFKLDHSKTQPTDDKSFLKGAWLQSYDHFKFLGPLIISVERLKLVAKFCAQVDYTKC